MTPPSTEEIEELDAGEASNIPIGPREIGSPGIRMSGDGEAPHLIDVSERLHEIGAEAKDRIRDVER